MRRYLVHPLSHEVNLASRARTHYRQHTLAVAQHDGKHYVGVDSLVGRRVGGFVAAHRRRHRYVPAILAVEALHHLAEHPSV